MALYEKGPPIHRRNLSEKIQAFFFFALNDSSCAPDNIARKNTIDQEEDTIDTNCGLLVPWYTVLQNNNDHVFYFLTLPCADSSQNLKKIDFLRKETQGIHYEELRNNRTTFAHTGILTTIHQFILMPYSNRCFNILWRFSSTIFSHSSPFGQKLWFDPKKCADSLSIATCGARRKNVNIYACEDLSGRDGVGLGESYSFWRSPPTRRCQPFFVEKAWPHEHCCVARNSAKCGTYHVAEEASGCCCGREMPWRNLVQTNGKVWCQFLCLKSYTGLFRNGFFPSFYEFVRKTFHSSSSLPILSKKGDLVFIHQMIRQEKVPLGCFKNKFILSAIR